MRCAACCWLAASINAWVFDPIEVAALMVGAVATCAAMGSLEGKVTPSADARSISGLLVRSSCVKSAFVAIDSESPRRWRLCVHRLSRSCMGHEEDPCTGSIGPDLDGNLNP
jgi:hypothetical protein